jgi:hypothetical protein
MTLDRADPAGEARIVADSSPSRSGSVGVPARKPAARRGAPRWLLAPLLALLLAVGCDRPFQPVPGNPREPFWIFGYLDLRADTQWVRVMPVRQNLLTDPDPIDALVTLEEVGSGRVLTLTDSLFRFTDERLGGVAYAHNFWTTEPLQAKGKYRVRAVRSDGAESTAQVALPADLEFSFLNLEGGGDTARLEVRAERVLLVDMIHGMRNAAGEPAGVVIRRQPATHPTGDPGIQALDVNESPPFQMGLVEIGRAELRIASVRSDWPFGPGLSDPDVTLPGSTASNVENGTGFVGGVATWTIPFHSCTVLAARPGSHPPCTLDYNARSASIAGRVIQEPCGTPRQRAEIRLTEVFAGGGAIMLAWKTGWDGAYRFEGLEPGADLALDLGPGTPAMRLPPLSPGQRYAVPDLAVSDGC